MKSIVKTEAHRVGVGRVEQGNAEVDSSVNHLIGTRLVLSAVKIGEWAASQAYGRDPELFRSELPVFHDLLLPVVT